MRPWAVAAVVVAVVGTLWVSRGPEPERNDRRRGHPPWTVEVLADGESRALGLTLGQSTLGDAIARFGKNVDAALFESPGHPPTLEAYYTDASAGGITGRLVLALESSPAVLEGLRQRSSGVRRMETGTIRYEVHVRDAEVVAGLPVRALTFVPTADLDEATVRARFGEPVERIPVGADAVRWIYPERGVSVTVSERAREVIEYVRPAEADRLREVTSPAP